VKALTIYQPWATLIMAGAKPYEFRGWDYRPREPALEGQRIVIHASARPIKRREVQDILMRLDEGSTGLLVDVARPIVERALTTPGVFPLASGLGTAVLGTARNAAALFRGVVNDSDRLDHSLWAWPLTDIRSFEPIVPARGLQGFWLWREVAP
jgi:hypothetical protein